MATLAQQKPRELLTRAAQCPHRIEAGPYQVAHCLMSAGTHTAVSQLAGPVQLRQIDRIPPVGFDPLARPLRGQRWRHHNAIVPARRQMTLDAIA